MPLGYPHDNYQFNCAVHSDSDYSYLRGAPSYPSRFIHDPLDAHNCQAPRSPQVARTPGAHNILHHPPLSPATPNESLPDYSDVATPPSLKSPEPSLPLNLENIVAKLDPLLERTATSDITEIAIEGVTPDVVEELRMKLKESNRSGWENLRYD